jgi:putative transposase
LRNKVPKRRVNARLRDDRPLPATRVNEMVDIFCWFSPALKPRQGFRGSDVIATLEESAMSGFPAAIRVDQASELVMSRDLDPGTYHAGQEICCKISSLNSASSSSNLETDPNQSLDAWRAGSR